MLQPPLRPAGGVLESLFIFASSGALNGMVVCEEAGQGTQRHTGLLAALSGGVTPQLYTACGGNIHCVSFSTALIHLLGIDCLRTGLSLRTAAATVRNILFLHEYSGEADWLVRRL